MHYEHFGDNGYGTIRTQAFQTDTPQTTPVVLHYARYRYQTERFANGSHLVWDLNLLSISRSVPFLLKQESRPIGHQAALPGAYLTRPPMGICLNRLFQPVATPIKYSTIPRTNQ